jgi:hypothetical protein
MIDESEIRGLAEYLVRTRGGDEARAFVEARVESSDQAAEWVRVAAAIDALLGRPRPTSVEPRRA